MFELKLSKEIVKCCFCPGFPHRWLPYPHLFLCFTSHCLTCWSISFNLRSYNWFHRLCVSSALILCISSGLWSKVSRAEADNWWNLQTALTEQRAEVMFYSLSTLQSKRRSVVCDCSVRKESPQCFLQLHGFLHFLVQLLCGETCGKELCFSFLLSVVLSQLEWRNMALLNRAP